MNFIRGRTIFKVVIQWRRRVGDSTEKLVHY
jgi:hypothetical protein